MAERADQEQKTRYFGEVDMRAAAGAGVVAAAASLVVLLLLAPVMGVNAMEPLYMIAAVVLGGEILAAAPVFNIGVVAAAVGVHLVLSLVYAFVLSAIIHNQSKAVGIGIGLGFGLMLYILNLYFFTALFPWFVDGRNWVGVLAHIVWGVSVGWVYVRAEVVFPKRRPLSEQPVG